MVSTVSYQPAMKAPTGCLSRVLAPPYPEWPMKRAKFDTMSRGCNWVPLYSITILYSIGCLPSSPLDMFLRFTCRIVEGPSALQ